jgi:hypothetical protein
MAKCFVTGVDLPLNNAYVLDIPAAYRALNDLRKQLASIDRLIQQLSPMDDAEVYDARKRETITRKERRLVSPAVAEVLSAAYSKEKLFMSLDDWRARRLKFNKFSSDNGNSGDNEHLPLDRAATAIKND